MQILGDDVINLSFNGQNCRSYERYIKINKDSVGKPTAVPNEWGNIETGALFVLITTDFHGSTWLEGEGPVHKAIFRTRYTDA